MPGSMSNYLEMALLNASLRNTPYTSPASIFLSLHTANPTDANTPGTEVTTAAWPNYARQNVANGGALTAAWTAPSNGPGSTSNALTLTFPAQTAAAPVVVTYFGLYDAATNGNLLYWANLDAAKTVNQTDVLTFPPGSIVINLD